MDENFESKIYDELVRIRRLLTILTQDKLASFNEKIEKTYLTTEQRKQMYDLFDGDNSYKTIADTVKVSPQAVSKFAIQLEKAGLLEYITINDRSKNPKRIF